MKNLQALANELAANKLTTLTANDLHTLKGGCSVSRSTTKSYSCRSTNSYGCGSKKTNNSCNNNAPGRGNGGGEG